MIIATGEVSTEAALDWLTKAALELLTSGIYKPGDSG